MSTIKLVKRPQLGHAKKMQTVKDNRPDAISTIDSMDIIPTARQGEILLDQDSSTYPIWDRPTDFGDGVATYDNKLSVLVKGIAYYEYHSMFLHAAKLIEIANKMQGHDSGDTSETDAKRDELRQKFVQIQRKYNDY